MQRSLRPALGVWSLRLNATPRMRMRSAGTLSGSSSSIPDPPLIKSLREGMKDAMRARDLPRANTFKSVLGDISNSAHAKAKQDPAKVLKKAMAVRIDALAKIPQASELAGQYQREIATLAEFLEEGERTAFEEAQTAAGKSSLPLPDLLKELRTSFGPKLDGDLIAAIGKSALAPKIP